MPPVLYFPCEIEFRAAAERKESRSAKLEFSEHPLLSAKFEEMLSIERFQ